MSGVSITGLNPASTLTGSEIVPIVQSGTTVRTTLAAMPYVPAGTGAVTTTVQTKLRETISVQDFGAVGDGIHDDGPAIQACIDLGRPFKLIENANHRVAQTLVWKSGAIMIGTTSGAISGSGGNTGSTIITFDNTSITTGIQLNTVSGSYLPNWGIDGVTFATSSAITGRASFKMFEVVSTGSGCYNFFLKNIMITDVQYGFYVDNAFFAFTFDNVAVQRAYKAFYKSSTSFITSADVKWFKLSYCFHGLDITNATYCDWDVYYDHCGLNATNVSEYPATEMPILQKFSNVSNFIGVVGIEESNAIVTRATSYTNIEQSIYYYNSSANLWQKSTTRVSNIAEADQAIFSIVTSFVKVKNMIVTATTPAASTTDPSYFARLTAGANDPRLILENCLLNMGAYCVCPDASLPYLIATSDKNTYINFGATNIALFRNSFGLERGRLRSGASTAQDYIQINREATFTEGDIAHVFTGYTSGTSVRFFAANGTSANAANAQIKCSAMTSNSRSINVGGTVNTNGADYAEYENNGGKTILKGQIVGFTAEGILTDQFSEAVRFGVKSTSPSFVGGDTWANHIGERPEKPADGIETPEYIAALTDFETQMESARNQVDRIAYSGKVPCNVFGATAGDYIIVVNDNGSISGQAVTDPTFAQYKFAVGRVNKILDDGRAEIAVIVH
jgi:hypothetical protein